MNHSTLLDIALAVSMWLFTFTLSLTEAKDWIVILSGSVTIAYTLWRFYRESKGKPKKK